MNSLPSRIARAGVLAGALACAWPGPAAAPEAVSPGPFESAVVQKGAQLAALGDCIVCHTAPDGRAYAGGRALPTPFGTIYGTNITPDRDMGIGQWTEGDFSRALREGVDRAGRQLYPAFPYDHFRHIGDEDIHALYAFLMTREPVSFTPPANELRFPFNLRPLIAVWKLMFLHRGDVPRDPRQSPAWNRGAYLVTGLGHCGACHTPHNALGAEKIDEALSGGEAEGWHAPAINAASRAPVPWTVDDMVVYLRGGIAANREVAGGPMMPVVHDLSSVPEEDVRSIASYIVSLQPAAASNNANPNARNDGRFENMPGAVVYRGACAQCHGAGRDVPDGALRFGLSTTVREPSPRNFLQIVLHGITPPDGAPPVWMPSFAGALTDTQLAQLSDYVRARFAPGLPAWTDVETQARNVRRNPESP